MLQIKNRPISEISKLNHLRNNEFILSFEPYCISKAFVLCLGFWCAWSFYFFYNASFVFVNIFICLVSVVTTLLSSLSLYLGTLNAAKLLHRRILFNIMRVPVTTFFDVTPLGRVLNRFSKDIDTLDNVLPMTLRGWVSCLYSVSTFNFAKAVIFKLFLMVKYYSRL